MDTEKSSEVLDASESPQPEETVMEKEAVSKLEAPEESTEPEKQPAADGETEQMAVNGHDTEVMNEKEAKEVVVTETVTSSEEKLIEASSPTEEASGPESVASPEPDESSEKISDPVAAVATEPENTPPEQPPVPENDPEPLPVQTSLANSVPEPEPDKSAELVSKAELQEQALPEPAVPPQPEITQPPNQEENGSEPAEAKSQAPMDRGAEEEAGSEAAAEPAKDEEKPTETVTLKEEDEAKPTEKKTEAEPEKPAESDTVKVTEETPGDEAAKSADADPPQEEDAVPAAGSLAFAFLEREQTKDALRTSRTLIILRGLPGSGKSFLARAIGDAYKDHCSVICADDHGVKPESPEPSVDGFKALDEAVVACCGAGTTSPLLMVVDDTNHTQDRLAHLGEIAEQHHLVAVFLEPRTEWSRDVPELTKKTKRGLEEAQMEAMRAQLDEVSLPLFFGWFLLSSVQDKIRCTSMDFLKTLDTLEAFKKHSVDFTGKADKDVDLEQYFQAKKELHCTTKFCNYGKAEGAKEYAQNPAVVDLYGCVFELSLTALFVTPRTVGARVSLTEEQLLLWPADAEKEAAASLPPGSRAHVTLGCAEGVEPVQTGLDLLEILSLQQDGQQGELVEEMELGSLTYYGEGRWLLSLREPICSPACFSSFYGRKEVEPAKKEPEKKKKQKCAIL